MANLIWSDDTGGDQIITLIKNDFLSMKFFPNWVKTLDAPFDACEWDFGLLHLVLNDRGDSIEKRFVGCPAFFHLRGQLAIVFRVKMLEREVFQFAAQPAHAHPMSDRCIYVHGLLCDAA